MMNWLPNLSSFALVALVAFAGMIAPAPVEAADPQLAHSVIFALKDHSTASRDKFVGMCEKYLTGHRGTVTFALGVIADDVVEPPSDREFDVTLHVVFENKAMLEAYLKSERHTQFVDAIKGSVAKARVFDSYLPVGKSKG